MGFRGLGFRDEHHESSGNEDSDDADAGVGDNHGFRKGSTCTEAGIDTK